MNYLHDQPFLKLMKLEENCVSVMDGGVMAMSGMWLGTSGVHRFSRTEISFNDDALFTKRFPELSPCFVDTTSSENLLRFNLFRYSRTKGIF